MIGDKTSIFPDGAEVRYRGTPVPRITSGTVWIWNAGKKTVRGTDIVELRFHLAVYASILYLL